MQRHIVNDILLENIRKLLIISKQNVLRSINLTMVRTYFEIGRLIVEEEQMGERRAKYGKMQLKEISISLTKEFGKGFSVRNLKSMRLFYQVYSIPGAVSPKSPNYGIAKFRKGETVSPQLTRYKMIREDALVTSSFSLSWSHYEFLMRLEESERKFYEIESSQNNWSLRELKRQYNSGLYERLMLSKNKSQIKDLSNKGQIIEKPEDLVKDPYILEFLGLKGEKTYTESQLEQKIIDNLQEFLLELGKGFTFVSRQKRITFDDQHFYIDLVFYNRLLRCFVLLDIKIGELRHQDLGQLQMYVNYFDRKVKRKNENLTIGIILCANKNDSIVEMTLPKKNTQLFASKYKLYLPTKEELIQQIKQ